MCICSIIVELTLFTYFYSKSIEFEALKCDCNCDLISIEFRFKMLAFNFIQFPRKLSALAHASLGKCLFVFNSNHLVLRTDKPRQLKQCPTRVINSRIVYKVTLNAKSESNKDFLDNQS